jgi:hypothetical protein
LVATGTLHRARCRPRPARLATVPKPGRRAASRQVNCLMNRGSMATCRSPELPGRPRDPCQQSRRRRLEGTESRLGTGSRVARVSPTTPTRAPGWPLALCRLDRHSCRRTLLAAERLSPRPVNAYARCVRDRGPWDVPGANSWVGRTGPTQQSSSRRKTGFYRMLTAAPDGRPRGDRRARLWVRSPRAPAR